jgi:hypothetical protein
MIILVSDTSVLVDLKKGQLLEPTFSSGLTLAVPDMLYDTELANQNGAYLQKLGLGVLTLSGDELAIVQEINAQRSGLSLPDCSALVCAMRPNFALLTSDGPLRAEAKRRKIPLYGILWLLDELEQTHQVACKILMDGLSQLAALPSCRLPPNEMKARLERWQQQLGQE